MGSTDRPYEQCPPGMLIFRPAGLDDVDRVQELEVRLAPCLLLVLVLVVMLVWGGGGGGGT